MVSYLVFFISFLGFVYVLIGFFFFKQKTAYEMRISDWSSDVCSSDLRGHRSGLLEPHKRIELLGHYGLEIMAEEFGLGTVNHADRAFEQWLPQRIGKVAARRPAPVREGARKAGAADRVIGRAHV